MAGWDDMRQIVTAARNIPDSGIRRTVGALMQTGLFANSRCVALAAAIAAFGFVNSAAASDMPVKADRPAPVAAYDWSGIYIGGDAGWQGSSIGLSNPFSVFGGGPGPLTYNPHHDSFALGAFVGIQRQFGQFVLGVEGGYISAFGYGSSVATTSVPIFVPGGTGTAQAKLKDIWSVGARIGWAMGQWMPYITGGYANGSFEFNSQSSATVAEQAKARTGDGYIGGGIDWALTKNWIIGVEYRHYAFSSKTVASTLTGVFVGTTEPVRFAPNTDTVLARVSYKFDWAPLW
jgi:outer membrane immunogenic protein